MDFISNKEEQINEMLKVIGVNSIEELFSSIPKDLRLPKFQEDDGLSEYEGLKLVEEISVKNTFPLYDNYIGAGAYEHHIPAVVPSICSKSEFLTSYTPYQAEASQGMLQAIFEYQSAICAITGLDVSNASVYDGASACSEALLMALRLQPNRRKVLVADSIHPHYRQVINCYLHEKNFQVVIIPTNNDGTLQSDALLDSIDDQTAAVLLGYPNFFGTVEDLKGLISHIKEKGALVIVSANPLVYGIYESAAEIGADIAVGELQPLGLSLSYGGPYVGYMSCKKELVRQMPGRIVGETVDANKKRGFVLTLQAREQHIRREKATSNICTNQALAALACLIAMLWYGKNGLRELALTNYQRANYLKSQLLESVNCKSLCDQPIFNEFAVNFGHDTKTVLRHFREHKIEPGLPLDNYYPALSGYFLIAVTETKSKMQLDRYIECAKKLAKSRGP